MNLTKTVAKNVRKYRELRFPNVRSACKHSDALAEKGKISKPITVPRWYRLEQGRHPGMVAEILSDIATVLNVKVESLIKPDEKAKRKGAKRVSANKKARRAD